MLYVSVACMHYGAFGQ